jgi:hypothetical protein
MTGFAPDSNVARLTLIVRIRAPHAELDRDLQQALDALRCVRAGGDQYVGELSPGCDEALRQLADACSRVGGAALLHAERAPAERGDGPYLRLWERTEEYAGALQAWRNGIGPIPTLLPGELVRLWG